MVGWPGRYFSRKVPTRRVVPSVPPPGAEPMITSLVLHLKVTSAAALPAVVSIAPPQRSVRATVFRLLCRSDDINCLPKLLWRPDSPPSDHGPIGTRCRNCRADLVRLPG